MDVTVASAVWVLGVPGLVLLGGIYHKVRRIHQMQYPMPTRKDLDASYRQLEALWGLHAQLEGNPGLPRLRGFAASPDFLWEVTKVIGQVRPATVVELGSGASTEVIARALARAGQGHVFSLDHDKAYADRTREMLRGSGLEEWATVIHAPLREQTYANRSFQWYDLASLPVRQVDFLVVDGPPEATQTEARYPALPGFAERFGEGAVVVLDDANRRDERAILARWQREFPEFRLEDRGCEKGCAFLFRQPDKAGEG